MLAHHLRHWVNIGLTLAEHLVLAKLGLNGTPCLTLRAAWSQAGIRWFRVNSCIHAIIWYYKQTNKQVSCFA